MPYFGGRRPIRMPANQMPNGHRPAGIPVAQRSVFHGPLPPFALAGGHPAMIRVPVLVKHEIIRTTPLPPTAHQPRMASQQNPWGLDLSSVEGSLVNIGSNTEHGDVLLETRNTGERGLRQSQININSTRKEGDFTSRATPQTSKAESTPEPANASQNVDPQPENRPQDQSAEEEEEPQEPPKPEPSNRPGDVTFIVEGREICAFKCVLKDKSPVLKNLIQGSVNGGPIQLASSIRLCAFEALLDYFADDFEPMRHCTEDCLQLAHKYMLTEFKSKCESILASRIDYSTAVPYALLAFKCGAKQLRRRAVEYIAECPSIKETQEFMGAIGDEPMLLLLDE